MSVLHFNSNLSKEKPNQYSGSKLLDCPFCDYEKLKTTNQILVHKEDSLWIENKFPVLSDTYQTVIVETENCVEFSEQSDTKAAKILKFSLECWLKMINGGLYTEVLFFKNHGIFSGASLKHPHMQIIGLKNPHHPLPLDFEKHLDGVPICSYPGVDVTISTVPFNEFYEFNFRIRNLNCKSFAITLLAVMNYSKEHISRNTFSYNFAFYIIDGEIWMKFIPRIPTSILHLGYRIPQTPTNLNEIASAIKLNIQKKNQS